MGIKSKSRIQEDRKLQEKAIRTINFIPVNAPGEKQIYEMNILNLDDLIMLQNTLFVKPIFLYSFLGITSNVFTRHFLKLCFLYSCGLI